MRAHASPPLPPPMTRKSVSFDMGAMVGAEVDNCRDRAASRKVGVLERMFGARRQRTAERLVHGRSRRRGVDRTSLMHPRAWPSLYLSRGPLPAISCRLDAVASKLSCAAETSEGKADV